MLAFLATMIGPSCVILRAAVAVGILIWSITQAITRETIRWWWIYVTHWILVAMAAYLVMVAGQELRARGHKYVQLEPRRTERTSSRLRKSASGNSNSGGRKLRHSRSRDRARSEESGVMLEMVSAHADMEHDARDLDSQATANGTPTAEPATTAAQRTRAPAKAIAKAKRKESSLDFGEESRVATTTTSPFDSARQVELLATIDKLHDAALPHPRKFAHSNGDDDAPPPPSDTPREVSSPVEPAVDPGSDDGRRVTGGQTSATADAETHASQPPGTDNLACALLTANAEDLDLQPSSSQQQQHSQPPSPQLQAQHQTGRNAATGTAHDEQGEEGEDSLTNGHEYTADITANDGRYEDCGIRADEWSQLDRQDVACRIEEALWSIVFPGALIVTILYWVLVYPYGPHPPRQVTVAEHTIPLLLMLLDTRTGRPTHACRAAALWSAAFWTVYVLWTVVFYLADFRDDAGNKYIYVMVRWDVMPWTAIVAPLLAGVAAPVLTLVCVCVARRCKQLGKLQMEPFGRRNGVRLDTI